MEETTVSHAIHHPVPAQWARSFFLALLPVLAVFLGGATSKWAEGIIVAFFGAFLVFQPPRRSLGWKINATFLAFPLCPLVSFLPQTWFFCPDSGLGPGRHSARPQTLDPLGDRADHCHRRHLPQFFPRGYRYSRGRERNLDCDRRAPG